VTPAPDVEALVDSLRLTVADPSRVSTGESIIALHAGDYGYDASRLPDVVVFPLSAEEVSAVLTCATTSRVPVVPYGAGTSGEGKTIPLQGGISLDLSRMDQIVTVHPDDFDVVVQPGVLRHALNRGLAEHGLFFPVDPGADASLGGMASTNASGTTFRQGSMRNNVLALQVVLADGTIMRTGARARKTTAGYDLTSLFVGAEGTLGVITELTLRVYGIPEHVIAARAAFPDLRAAARAAVAISNGVPSVSRLEILDGPTIAIFNDHYGTELTEAPTLFLELAGSRGMLDEDIELIVGLGEEYATTGIHFERDRTAQHQLWAARHNFGNALMVRHPGRSATATDVCVPLSVLPDAIVHARDILRERDLDAALLGHAGDGNFHFVFMLDAGDPEEIAAYKRFYREIVEYALERGGTSTAEHGVGVSKIEFLVREHGDLMPSMCAIKRALDPENILNPGKIIPAQMLEPTSA
jgi:D-lactate dehydrogenase (cytochrome)